MEGSGRGDLQRNALIRSILYTLYAFVILDFSSTEYAYLCSRIEVIKTSNCSTEKLISSSMNDQNYTKLYKAPEIEVEVVVRCIEIGPTAL